MGDHPAELRCEHCDRTIEWCSFCDEEGCATALCFTCVVTDLKELTPHPHPHGG